MRFAIALALLTVSCSSGGRQHDPSANDLTAVAGSRRLQHPIRDGRPERGCGLRAEI